MTEARWSTKLKIFITWPFAELSLLSPDLDCRHLYQALGIETDVSMPSA